MDTKKLDQYRASRAALEETTVGKPPRENALRAGFRETLVGKLPRENALRAGFRETMVGKPPRENFEPPNRKTAVEVEAFKERIRSEEGKGKKDRPGYMYRDTKGYRTIGYGHKVTPKDSIEFPKLFGKGFDTVGVLSGKVPLTDKQMDFVLSKDFDEKTKSSKRLFPKYDSYSHELKGAILDGVFRGDLSGSPKTIKLINEGKFTLASKEYVNHTGYRKSKRGEEGFGSGIYKRMDRNAAIFKAEQFRQK